MKTNNLENIWPRYHVKWLFGGLPFMLKYPLSDLALHVGYQSRVSTSFDWLSSSCHHVIMSSTHHVIVSYCHRVIMLSCHHVSSYHRVIMSPYWIWHCMPGINHWLAQVLTDRHQMSPYCYHSAIVIILSSGFLYNCIQY